MGENSIMEKSCSSCGQANKAEDQYCKYCGASLEGIHPVEIGSDQITDDSEPNKLVITKNLKLQKRGNIFVCLCCVILILSLVIFVGPRVFPPFLAGFLIAVALIFCLIPGIIFTLIFKARYADADIPRTFSISDNKIALDVPKKPKFQINWSDFDTIQVKKFTGGHSTIGLYGGAPSNDSFHLNFFLNDNLTQTFDIEGGKDFPVDTCYYIRDILKEYAIRLNKEFIKGRKKKKKKK